MRSDSCRSAVAAFHGRFAMYAENIYLGSRVRPVESEPRCSRGLCLNSMYDRSRPGAVRVHNKKITTSELESQL